ncbi:MAG TPA: cofactor-independent phosphoglycerate mutase [Oscillospiraceae bacterium]|nr:cofactor-independent phosphoglycerate mutase [Oscillospiraceae bacterium]
MKYIVLLYDGMSDYPVKALDGKTPMEVAKKPILDRLASNSEVGLVKTVADGLIPGSDIANMSVLGYNPKENYTGRSPLEAVSIGVPMVDSDIIFRCNIVTLSDECDYENKTMTDYSAGDISTKEAKEIIKSVQEHFGNDEFEFYNGVSYRHCLVWHNGTPHLGELTPPHDITGKKIKTYLSNNKNARVLINMMKESYNLLSSHPVNVKRVKEGKRPANSIWLWGEGTKPSLPSFHEKYGLKASVVSAVDLLKGIASCAGMCAPNVEGATGYIDTNFEGKAKTALDELKNGKDLVYIHIEAPDECGHRNEPENKVRSIELIDEQVLNILIDGLEIYDDYKILALPDHPTPIATMTHASDPVPYMIYHKKKHKPNSVKTFTEKTAKETGVFIEHGHTLMKHFIND